MGLEDFDGAQDRLAALGLGLGQPLHLRSETTSTNDEAKAAARAGAAHGAVWVADVQTQGRGRQGRSWLSVPGESLLMSVLLRWPCATHRLPLVSLAAGLAVHDAVATLTQGDRHGLKWPNDIVLRVGQCQKVAGILVESLGVGTSAPAVVVGIGINVLSKTFPEEIRQRATSLALMSDTEVSRLNVLIAILKEMENTVPRVMAFGLGCIRDRLQKADALAGRTVRSEGGEGIAQGVDDDGRLRVCRADGTTTTWHAGEVHLVSSQGIL